MSTDFISQFAIANSGTMVPVRYIRWSAIALLFATIGRKVYVEHGHFKLYPGFYLCLVGSAASRKTTAKDWARDMFLEVFPDYPTGASITSREDIIKFLASDECLRSYEDETGTPVEWRPLAFFINELTNFLSFNPKSMIEFLTDIYDRKFFDSSTIARGKEIIVHPYVSLLACTTPENIVDILRAKTIGGGFFRRILLVYEVELPPKITFPVKTKEALVAETWCKAHLQKIVKVVGPFSWTPEARVALDVWYTAPGGKRDGILAGYYEAKDALVQKIAMCLALAEEEPKLVFTAQIIETAIAFLESIEDNLHRLTVAIGRNELAVPQQQLLQLLEDSGGMMPEKLWHARACQELTEPEYSSVLRLLKNIDRVFEISQNGVNFLLSPIRYAQWKEKGLIK